MSYTMINLPLAAETLQPCNPIPNNEWTQTGLPEANWVELHDVPKAFKPVRGSACVFKCARGFFWGGGCMGVWACGGRKVGA